MKQYAIKKNDGNKNVPVLMYDESTKTFTIDIPKDVSEMELPFMLALYAQKGVYHMNPEASMKWVQSRIVPSSRQNIGEILKNNSMKSYDEYRLLINVNGRCGQDDYYLERMSDKQEIG